MFQQVRIRLTSRFAFSKEDNVDFELLSLNVRGIRSSAKRKALFLWLNKQNADVIFLQETYSTKEIEAICKTPFKGKMIYSHGTNHSCEVMILIKDDLKSSVLDTEGRYILMDATVQGSDFLFVNIYAPNKVQDQCEFFNALNTLIEKFHDSAEQKIVLGGDFNITLDPDWDCSGGNPTKKDSVKHIQDICLNFDLVDVWRVRNPECKRFTWRQYRRTKAWPIILEI